MRNVQVRRWCEFLLLGLFGAVAASVRAVPAEDCWDVFGSFGFARGEAQRTADGFSFVARDYRLDTTVEVGVGGVERRRTVLRNLSDRPISARCLLDRMIFGGDEFEVYTQANTWQQESRGAWMPLNTGVEVRAPKMRSSFGAAPMLALWNVQTGRGRAFHVLSDASWAIHVLREPTYGENTRVAVEIGMDSRHLDYSVGPGETLAFPEILSYAFENRLDLDCHRLHAYWNARYPGKPLPSVYNTWLCRFDKLDADFVLRQVERAKRIGLDYFVLDAGWFGKRDDWFKTRGDWRERSDGALKGRMAEISAAVRDAGMKFGFWVEAEAANAESEVVKAHPDWFFDRGGSERYLDFRNRAAFDSLLETVCGLLAKYGASYLKLDFNQDAGFDTTGKAFAEYNAAYRAFIRAVRQRNPGVYIEGCASGGLMMDLGWARDYDSFWLSDNQSPYHGIRIVKDTMLRMPPRMIERWVTAASLAGGQPNYTGDTKRLIVTEDACWYGIRSANASIVDAFTAGGPLGLSCDLTAFSEEMLQHLAALVAERRREGDFWSRTEGRVLCDTPTLTALQYSDAAFDEVRVFVIADRPRQNWATVHPVLDPKASYRIGSEVRTAADIAKNGLSVPVANSSATQRRLVRVVGAADRSTVTVTQGKDRRTVEIDPPDVVRVIGEEMTGLVTKDPKVRPWSILAEHPDPLYWGWTAGSRPQRYAACECTARFSLLPETLVVRKRDGTLCQSGRDYELEPTWGAVARLEGGRIGRDETVLLDYACRMRRLDLVYLDGDGRMRVRRGVPAPVMPVAPALAPGERKVATVWVDPKDAKVTEKNIFYVTEDRFPEKTYAAGDWPAEKLLPKTLAKLRQGETVRILAWGDSVTEGEYLPERDRWQNQFVARLHKAYPRATIELESRGWGGKGSATFMSTTTAPAGVNHPFNYRERILGSDADLVVMEFVNDAGLSRETVYSRYGKILADLRTAGKEWCILTPHYTRGDWMGLASQQDIDDDPRAYVKALRTFCAEKGVAIADAAARWGRLYRQGIPYESLLVNTINHPNGQGMGYFADALMALFPKER